MISIDTEQGHELQITTMDHHDKRAIARREISHTVRIATGISPPLECQMSDVSPIGARLLVHDSQTVPQQFVIILNPKLTRWCEVMWRSDKAVGVQFMRAPKTVAKKLKPATVPVADASSAA